MDFAGFERSNLLFSLSNLTLLNLDELTLAQFNPYYNDTAIAVEIRRLWEARTKTGMAKTDAKIPSKDSKWTSFESLPLDFKFDSNNLSTLTTAQLVVLRWADGIHYSTELAYAVEEEFYRRRELSHAQVGPIKNNEIESNGAFKVQVKANDWLLDESDQDEMDNSARVPDRVPAAKSRMEADAERRKEARRIQDLANGTREASINRDRSRSPDSRGNGRRSVVPTGSNGDIIKRVNRFESTSKGDRLPYSSRPTVDRGGMDELSHYSLRQTKPDSPPFEPVRPSFEVPLKMTALWTIIFINYIPVSKTTAQLISRFASRSRCCILAFRRSARISVSEATGGAIIFGFAAVADERGARDAIEACHRTPLGSESLTVAISHSVINWKVDELEKSVRDQVIGEGSSSRWFQ